MKIIPTQNQIVKKIMKESIAVIRDIYFKKELSGSEVQELYSKTYGYTKPLFELTQNWFNTEIAPNPKGIGLNDLGYQRLIATALMLWETTDEKER